MVYRLLADAIVVLHVGFVLFVVLGGFVAWRFRRMAWIHIPAALYGTAIEFVGWVCPLTPIENHFRQLARDAQYAGGFVEHYVVPVLYLEGSALDVRIVLGSAVLVVNAVAYAVYFKRQSHRVHTTTAPFTTENERTS